MVKRLGSMLRALVARRRFEDDMSEELRIHIEHYADDLMRSGVPRDEAMRCARVEFGSVENVKDDCREARGLRLLDDLRRDTRHAVRLMRRSPGFTSPPSPRSPSASAQTSRSSPSSTPCCSARCRSRTPTT